MANKLMIILANADPGDAAQLAVPLFQATVAAALDYEVELVLTGRAGTLAKKGVAAALRAQGGSGRSVQDYLHEAHAAGVRLLLCSAAPELNPHDLLPEIAETVGGAYVVQRALDDGVVTLTY